MQIENKNYCRNPENLYFWSESKLLHVPVILGKNDIFISHKHFLNHNDMFTIHEMHSARTLNIMTFTLL